MRIPLNVTAELVTKLEADSLALQNQIGSCEEIIAKNLEGVAALEPFAEWGEETTP
jgi:hypothetical protein